jgi:hypothetical protein
MLMHLPAAYRHGPFGARSGDALTRRLSPGLVSAACRRRSTSPRARCRTGRPPPDGRSARSDSGCGGAGTTHSSWSGRTPGTGAAPPTWCPGPGSPGRPQADRPGPAGPRSWRDARTRHLVRGSRCRPRAIRSQNAGHGYAHGATVLLTSGESNFYGSMTQRPVRRRNERIPAPAFPVSSPRSTITRQGSSIRPGRARSGC